MNRRNFVLGAGAVMIGGGLLERPSSNGRPDDAYFRALNEELKKNGPMRPCLVIDLDRLDHNIDLVARSVKAPKHYRIVEKSLPSTKLIEYIAKRADTKRLMSFHQPFVNDDAAAFPDSDILIGKPLPVRSAELFYKNLKSTFDPARQLQWLVDTPEHLKQYLELAKGLGTKLRVNIEIDVGLHRGGVRSNESLGQILGLISAYPQSLDLSGFMGYDPHAGMAVPRLLGSHEELFRKGMAIYQGFVDFTRNRYATLWREDLTLNAAGSPTYKLHEGETLSNDISVARRCSSPRITISTPSPSMCRRPTSPRPSSRRSARSNCQRSRRHHASSPCGTRTSARPISSTAAPGWRSTSRPRACSSMRPTATAPIRKSSTPRPKSDWRWTIRCFSDRCRASSCCCSLAIFVAVRDGRVVDYWAPLSG
jgi:D-serine deaminase-like pyridoxal phosphate-dependent protein